MKYLMAAVPTKDLQDFQVDLLIDALGEAGFDSFDADADGIKAYATEDVYNEEAFKATIHAYLSESDFNQYLSSVESANWNEVWESNFKPVEIGTECYIRADFHDSKPGYKYEIVITPKMAFGTGHHDTTAQMAMLLMDESCTGKCVLDMGCGTGVLAILACKMGAKDVWAVDYDEVCVESTKENAALNGAGDIKVYKGSAEILPANAFDIILANINRNILLQQLPYYKKAMHGEGILMISGFYDADDLNVLSEAAGTLGYEMIKKISNNSWAAAKFKISK